MLYIVNGEWAEDSSLSTEDLPALWEQMVRPKVAGEKKT